MATITEGHDGYTVMYLDGVRKKMSDLRNDIAPLLIKYAELGTTALIGKHVDTIARMDISLEQEIQVLLELVEEAKAHGNE